jgi:hypothetical protein
MSNANVPWISQVTVLNNGEDVSAQSVNPVFDQLSQNDQYLYNTLQELQNKSVLVAPGLPLSSSEITAGVMTPGTQWCVYYYNNLITGEKGIKRALSEFGNSLSTAFYSPNISSYGFGITQNISNTSADVYMEGLLSLTSPLDDPVNGLLDISSTGVRETFSPGPLFLSSKTPGLLTGTPSGLSVYIGYAIDDSTIILNPQVDQFSALFYSVQLQVLDRPAGTPVNTGGVWTITSPDLTRLGWVPVSVLPTSYTIPSGATFFYNIPNVFTTDNADNSGAGSLSTFEKQQATLLLNLLPPDPAAQSILTTNGVSQIQVNSTDVNGKNGIYSIDQYGLWWYSNTAPTQPWAEDLASGSWTPAMWPTVVSSDIERPIIQLLITKFNPNLKDVIVSSLTAYDDGTVNMIKFLNADNLSLPASTGNIVVQTTTNFDTPVDSTANPTAIVNLTFSQATGKLTLTTAPIVSTLTTPTNSGLSLTNDTNGNYVITQNGQGSVGALDSLDPVNSTLEFLGLNSYIRLKYSSPSPAGIIGKILLPKLFPVNMSLKLVLHVFGFTNTTSTPLNVGFSFQYAISTAGGPPISNSTTFTTTTLAPAIITFPANYTALSPLAVQPTLLVIPGASIGPDTIINFKLLQSTAPTNPYNYDIGILDIYWSLI